jgi:hypothetical protein
MHIIKEYQAPTTVKLIQRGGVFWRFDSIYAAVKHLGLRWIYANVGEQFQVYSHTSWHHCAKVDRIGTARFDDPSYPVRHFKNVEFIMRGPAGAPLTYAQINAASWRPHTPGRHSRGRYPLWNGSGAVPGTGRQRRNSQLRGRAARHANAIRATETFKDEGEVPARNRWVETLWQDPWGDDYATERRDRNWKRYRKTQWK